MSAADKQVFIFAAKITEGEPNIKGSKITPCIDCKSDCWISPTSQDIIANENAKVLCIKCGVKRAKKEAEIGEETHVRITPAQIKEINKELGNDAQ